MRNHFSRRRYYIERLEYRLEQKFQDRLAEPIGRGRKRVLFGGNPMHDENYPPEYPYGPDYDGDECELCGCNCGGERDHYEETDY